MFRLNYDKITKCALKYAKYVAKCESCQFYDLETKVCENTQVTPYDFIDGKDEGRSYCCFWLPVGIECEERF